MAAVYEDDFGFRGIDCPEESAFFKTSRANVQSQSISTICERCKCSVWLNPTKTMRGASLRGLKKQKIGPN